MTTIEPPSAALRAVITTVGEQDFMAIAGSQSGRDNENLALGRSYL
jgi:hypothetical protein